jgi:3',5'-cyclic AMP phosphodiesterase CpdA
MAPRRRIAGGVSVPPRARLAATLAAALGVLAVAVAIAAGRSGDDARPGRADGSDSTLTATWRDPDGDGLLARGAGEPLADRTELAPVARPGETLATVAVLTDVHVRDEESPGRVPFLDRLGRPFSSTFRPQEALSAQVLAAGVRAVNAAEPDATLVTGDLVDEPQANELALAGAVLRGGTARPDSGAPGYDGVQRAGNPDPAFYRPDVDPPRRPGLLERAQRAFRSPGLRSPWLIAPGNHDLLLAGQLPATTTTNDVAVGDRTLVEPFEDLDVPRDENALTTELIDSLLAEGPPGTTRRVPPDAERRQLGPVEGAEALARLDGRGVNAATGRLDRVLDLGRRVRVIALDTVRRSGTSGGVVTAAQRAWLAQQLRAAGERWVLVASHHPLTKVSGGAAVLALLDRSPRVVAALGGDSHVNRIRARRSAAGGYWIVQTASLADFPQQARALRLRTTAGGGVALETWMLDTAPDPGGADVARELAHLDAQGGRPSGAAGERADRNVRLHKGLTR